MLKQSVILSILLIFSLLGTQLAHAEPKYRGIYINQGTLENAKRMEYLINQSKAVGINTFVVDLEKVTPNYKSRIQNIKENGIRYVARVVVYPDGARTSAQLKSKEHLAKRLKLIENAIQMGADEIQLDYIRYSSKNKPSPQNVEDVKEIIKFFKKEVAANNIPLQIDIFGEVSHIESPRIGQNVVKFSDTVDAVCPMVYPSHYYPWQKHSKQPYQTVYNSLEALKGKFEGEKLPFRLNPYIEASNYRMKMSPHQKGIYVMSQIRAVEDANADGWFIWSAKNHYDHVFDALKNRSKGKEIAKNDEPMEKALGNRADSKQPMINKQPAKNMAPAPQKASTFFKRPMNPQKVSNKPMKAQSHPAAGF